MAKTHHKKDNPWEVHSVDLGEYAGQWHEGKPNGFGTMIFKHEDPRYKIDGWKSYTGNWSEGVPNGPGSIIHTDGAR